MALVAADFTGCEKRQKVVIPNKVRDLRFVRRLHHVSITANSPFRTRGAGLSSRQPFSRSAAILPAIFTRHHALTLFQVRPKRTRNPALYSDHSTLLSTSAFLPRRR
jgi:hypothetical protein